MELSFPVQTVAERFKARCVTCDLPEMKECLESRSHKVGYNILAMEQPLPHSGASLVLMVMLRESL